MEHAQVKARLSTAAFAFRGYDVTNLGRSDELLAHHLYGRVVREELQKASRAYTQITGRPMDLVARVEARHEPTWEAYADAVVLVLAMETAQLRLLEELFDIRACSAQLAYGHSLGELAALAAGGVFRLEEILRVTLPLADDVIELARDVTLAVLFSRGCELPLGEIRRLCVQVNQDGRGIMGISTYLSPNSLLLMGQADTLDRFEDSVRKGSPGRLSVRRKEGRWAPLHTPIIRTGHVRA